jgi:hypothetical protein
MERTANALAAYSSGRLYHTHGGQAMKPNVPIKEAVQRLGCKPETIRVGLRNGTFPVGFAIRTTPTRWTYIIPREAFERVLKGIRQ